MLEGFISLASHSLGGGGIGNILFQWEQAGVFSYLLPFLLIFALMFGILSRTNLFGDNKAINVILSIAVGLMALQFQFVPYFFAEIFPRMGVMLSIILVGLVLLGLFFKFDEGSTGAKWFGGFVIFGIAVILYQSFGSKLGFSGVGTGWGFTAFWHQYGEAILIFIVVVGGIFATVKFSGKKKP